MSTVQSLYDLIQYRKDIQTQADALLPIVNNAVRTISKRLYVLESELIVDQMSVDIFKQVYTYELLTLDVAPGVAWVAGNTIKGNTSLVTCIIVTVLTTKTFIVKDRSGTFTLGEILTNGSSTADQGAANPTCVSSMVFVDSNPDTITDANAQFVAAGFQAGMVITSDQASNPGPFTLATVAAGTMTLTTAGSVVAGSGSFKITSDNSYGFLPSDFWGLKDKPYVSGMKYPLLPLPSVDVALRYTTGVPIYYKVRGDKIYVTPYTGSDYSIIADYYKRPTQLTAVTDTVPFNELFDDLIAEYIVKFFSPSAAEVGLLNEALRYGVDLVAAKYEKKGPVATSGINWAALMGEDNGCR